MSIRDCVRHYHVAASPRGETQPHPWPLVQTPLAIDVDARQQPCHRHMHWLALHGAAGRRSSSGAEISLVGWAGQLGDRDPGVSEKDLTTAGSDQKSVQTL